MEDVKIQLQTKNMIISDLERELAESIQQKQKTATQVLESNERLVHLQSELSCLQQIHEDNMKEIAEKDICITKLQANIQLLQQEGADTHAQLEASRKQVEQQRRELSEFHQKEETLLCEIQKREIKMCALVKELTESKEQNSECQKELLRKENALERLRKERDKLRAMMEDRSRECVHLRKTKDKLEADLALSHEKLHTLHLEVRSRDQFILQLRAEMKTAEHEHQRTQKQVTALEEEVRRLNHTINAHKEEACQLRKRVRDIEHLKDQKEKEQQQLQEQLHIREQQVDTFEQKLKEKKDEMELLNQQLKESKHGFREADLQTREQKVMAEIFKQKYTAAIEKARQVQEHVECLEEELRYSQEQLRESQLATYSVKEELAGLEHRYQEKVGQWESSQEALDQLTDELQANHSLLRESQQKVEHFNSQMRSLQEQMETLNQQKLTVECDLQLYQQNHSHSDEEYLSLVRLRQQLQKRCAEQVEHLAVCENTILQMKSELERQAKEKLGLRQSLAVSQHLHRSNQNQLEQEVIHLKQEVASLELELANTQQVQVTLLRQSEKELKDARRESERMSRELDVQERKKQILQKELHKEQEKMKTAIRENETLSTHIWKLGEELEVLRSTHQVTVEELAARAEEVRRMEGCLNEGKLAEEKIRSMAVRLEKEMTESVDQKLKAEREKQDALDQVNTLQSELERIRSDNANLLHESQLVMTNVNLWITEQKASNESLVAQMKAQSKVLLIIGEDKEHLQEANDTLKAEVKRLKKVVDDKESDMERFKAQVRDGGSQHDRKTMEKKGCVALNLSKIEDMQTRLQSNLEAIGMLNQQLSVLSWENKQLRRQLKEERSKHRQVELSGPPPTSSLFLGANPPPLSASFPSSLDLPHLLGLYPVTGDTNGTQTKLSRAGEERPGEFKASAKAPLIRPSSESAVSTSVEDAWSEGTSRHLAK